MEIGDASKYFSTIEEAWTYAQENSSDSSTAVVTLLTDVVVTSPLTVTSGNITLAGVGGDGNIHSISGNIPYDSATSIPAIIHVTGGVLTFQSGTINSTNAQGEGIRVTAGILNMKGGTIYAGGEGILVASSGAVVNIESGSISGESRGLSVSAAGKVTLSGGTFSSTSYGNAVFCYTGKSVGSILEENYAYKQNDSWVSDTSVGTLKGTVIVEEAPIKNLIVKADKSDVTVSLDEVVTITAEVELSKDYTDSDVTYKWYCGGHLLYETKEMVYIPEWSGMQTFICEVSCDGYTVTGSAVINVREPDAIAYTITIPATAVAGGDAVSVGINTKEPFNLNGGTVSVSVSGGIDKNGKLTLTNTDNSGSSVTSEMLVEGKKYTGGAVAEFKAESDPAVSLSFKEPTETNILAGTYEGTVTFSIDYTAAEGGTTE